MKSIVMGLFENKSRAQTVAQELAKAGFNRSDIHQASNESEFSRAISGTHMLDEESRFYTNEIRRGGSLISVETTPERAERVAQILRSHNARIADFRQMDEREVAIPVIEEELQIGKRMVERGGVRIYSHVTEHPVEQQVHLREERINVERRPVDRIASEQDMGVFQQGRIEVTEMAEEPVIAKQPHVVEEVIVSKELVDHTETIRDTARRADVEIERLSEIGERRAPAQPPAARRMEESGMAASHQAHAAIPNDLRRLKDLRDYEVAENEVDPRGWRLVGRDGHDIGKIDSLIASPSAGRAYFAVVDTGGWLQNKLFAVPLAVISFDRAQSKARAPYIKEQFRSAPEYHESDRDFHRHFDYWSGSTGGFAGVAGSGR
ncbi:MAG: DUF2382 domain-containing protein [Blastocatellales bacterium]